MIDRDALTEVIADSFSTLIERQHGQDGVAALKHLLAALKRLYAELEPATYRFPIIVFAPLQDADRPLDQATAVVITDLTLVRTEAQGPLAVHALQDGRFLVWKHTTPDVAQLSGTSVVYSYTNGTESFVAKGLSRVVRKVDTSARSAFAIPTFSSLEDALNAYGVEMARKSSCKILEDIWYDDRRIFLKSAQEWRMRDSLRQFLVSRLRPHAEVREEQNVDASHPVDIKITWVFARRIALIEIKWLGHSKHTGPRARRGKIAKRYYDARAREGAQQLADYLDSNATKAPTHTTMGYLAVFDARRRGLKQSTRSLSQAEGLYYSTKDIQYNPRFDSVRDDFASPVRFFIEPRV